MKNLLFGIICLLVAISCDRPNGCIYQEVEFRDYYGPGTNDFDVVVIMVEDCL